MKTSGYGLYPHALISLPALVMATSCVPADRPAAIARVQPERNSRALLSRMALHVPDDISAKIATAAPDASFAAAAAFVAPPFLTSNSVDDASRAAECLTAAVYYEARSQSEDGQRAVAQVVLNRVRDRAFPNSVCGVVYQGAERRTGCQFSFTCDGSMNRARESGAWDRARAVASAALGGSVYAPVGAATSFHTTSILPWWASSLARITTVGAHVFYRWQGALERALTFRQAYAGVEPGVRGDGFSGGGVTAVAAQVAGVSVHYGNRDDVADSGAEPADALHGVTVHRGALRSGSTMAGAAIVQTRLVSGVRIHVGGRASAMIGSGTGGDAVVSDET
ncbi:spore germination cell wall hydrolase CwlJ-like protein [Sphingomonas sp. PP-F2F-G114-C0414]|uniref:cell wall hydrolase n=1 Tax=Sphingomonas sp. PP-F2F-G114-C0414 TaxID=2135662 RepID=UPI000EF94192|nr:cell wall hydrolase [Sphingomonas sp. PP-F2F-G114-C0414]RMB36823.1 spore germination cell wall hydrolase CwlJ-like protein [Sphingomonas sp. PP-F2F-G114-C0414]